MKRKFCTMFGAFALLIWSNAGIAQERGDQDAGKKVHIALRPGFHIPIPLGNNFLPQAYNSKLGFVMDTRAYFNREGFYLGLQLHYFRALVTEPVLVGDFDRTDVTHSSVTAGIPLLPPDSPFGLDTGIGLGYAHYGNEEDGIFFRDDGFSIQGNVNATYRLGKVVGLYVGLQYTRDFLSIKTAPEKDSFLNNASLLDIFVGISFHITR